MITESLQNKIEQSIRLLQQVQQAHPDDYEEAQLVTDQDSDQDSVQEEQSEQCTDEAENAPESEENAPEAEDIA